MFRAPGRVNLMGEHTDYNDGLVMPAALRRACYAAVDRRPDRRLVAYSETLDQTIDLPVDDYPRRTGTWADYVAGVLVMLREHGVPVVGANLLVHGDVPVGAGLSSSAALEVSVALALLDACHTELDRTTLARLCQRGENEIAGARCGIMDQYIACHAHEGAALVIDCRAITHRVVPLPSQLRMVACNSMVRHSIATGEYNRRREECAAAVASIARGRPEVTSLRDLSVSCLDTLHRDLEPTLFRRVRHVVTENARVEALAAALLQQRLEAVAELMADSHRSMQNDYEISCAEVDTLVEIASDMPGVYGVRMTGGGFGGCAIALVHEEAVNEFSRLVPRLYESRTGLRPELYVSAAAAAAGSVTS